MSYDIVGYSYSADNYCDECIIPVVAGVPLGTSYTTEQALGKCAEVKGVDRTDESSYDSGDFPKVIFADQVHNGCNAGNGYVPGRCGDRCGRCGKSIGFDCPNTEH